MAAKTQPKYRITLFHPSWWKPWGDHQVSLEKWDGRSKKYKPMGLGFVEVQDAKRG